MTFIAATVYIPIFTQGVLGGTAANAGLILTPMMLGSVVDSQLGGFLTTKTSYRNIMLGASLFFVPGIFLLGMLAPNTARSTMVLDMSLTGFGVGFSFSVLTMAAVHNFGIRQRGSATATNRFMISLGTTLVITVFGILQRNLFTSKMTGLLAGTAPTSNRNVPYITNALLTPAGRAKVPPVALHKIMDALSLSISHTFLWALIPAALAVVCIFLMSNERMTVAAEPSPKANGEGQKQARIESANSTGQRSDDV